MTTDTNQQVKVFISHHNSQKASASQLKTMLDEVGCTAFVAHEDIKPTQEWAKVITTELHAMDVLIGLGGEKFNQSAWCQQEIGWAMGRGIPAYMINAENNAPPQGFIGQLQAFRTKGDTAESRRKIFIDELITVLSTEPSVHVKLRKNLVGCLGTSKSYQHTDAIIGHLQKFKEYDDEDRVSVITTYNTNHQVRDCHYARSRLTDILNIASFKQL